MDEASDSKIDDSKKITPEKKSQDGENEKSANILLYIFIASVIAGILVEFLAFTPNKKQAETKETIIKNYWVYSANNNVENPNGLLKHVHLVLKRFGYEKVTNKSTWNLLWSHDYPFRQLYPNLHKLKPYQTVNHFPGSGFITNKVDLATTDLKQIPKAFKLPKNKKEFVEYAKNNPKSMFVEKHNQHRGVVLKNVSDIDASSGDSFVQEYIQNPYLVDGYKFDIGVYVVLTSVNPLRAYWYKGDVLFRYCPEKYYPFDPTNLDKYVVADDYLPTWEVPSLAHLYKTLGYSMKDSFDAYVRSKGQNPSKIWEEVQEAIADALLAKEPHIVEALKNYPSSTNFFEMMRFDLVLDEELKVYLLEANMSPNLSSAHFPPNQVLYEQVLYNLFSITGVADGMEEKESQAAKSMKSTYKNIAVYSEQCKSVCRDSCDANDVCALCRPCIDAKLLGSLLRAHGEFLRKGDFVKLFPPSLKPDAKMELRSISHLSKMNQLQYLWYQGKCNIDATWCT